MSDLLFRQVWMIITMFIIFPLVAVTAYGWYGLGLVTCSYLPLINFNKKEKDGNN